MDSDHRCEWRGRRPHALEVTTMSQTPASCSNIALHNIYPGEIDLVISGPNRTFRLVTFISLS